MQIYSIKFLNGSSSGSNKDAVWEPLSKGGRKRITPFGNLLCNKRQSSLRIGNEEMIVSGNRLSSVSKFEQSKNGCGSVRR